MFYLNHLRLFLLSGLHDGIIRSVDALLLDDAMIERIKGIAVSTIAATACLVVYGVGKIIPNASCLGDKKLRRVDISSFNKLIDDFKGNNDRPINEVVNNIVEKAQEPLTYHADRANSLLLFYLVYILCTVASDKGNRLDTVRGVATAMEEENIVQKIQALKGIALSLTGKRVFPLFESLLIKCKRKLLGNRIDDRHLLNGRYWNFMIHIDSCDMGIRNVDNNRNNTSIKFIILRWIVCNIFNNKYKIIDFIFSKLKQKNGLDWQDPLEKEVRTVLRLDVLDILEQAGIEEDEIQDYYDFRSGITKKGVEKMLESMGVIKKDSEIMKGFFVRVALAIGSIAISIFCTKKAWHHLAYSDLKL